MIPQMSPLSWLILYMYMYIIMLMVNIILNYLFMIDSFKECKFTVTNNNFKWMW